LFERGASPTQYFSGAPQISAQQLPNGSWQGTIAQGTFKRDMRANASYTGPVTSQFYNMVKDEEIFHKGQLEGTSSNIISDLWLAQNVMNEVNAKGPYLAPTQNAATALVQNSFQAALTNETTRSEVIAFTYPPGPNGRRCRIEAEAKNAAGARFRVILKCTYTACP
jgi:hypothetical protein